jgi:hypothetical protein
VFECTIEFGLNLVIPDVDVSLIQECVGFASLYPELGDDWCDAIALILTMMNTLQRDFFRLETLYPRVVDRLILKGTRGDPIEVV